MCVMYIHINDFWCLDDDFKVRYIVCFFFVGIRH